MKQAVAVALACVLATIGAVWLLAPRDEGASAPPTTATAPDTTVAAETAAARAWDRRVGEALAPLVAAVPDLVRHAREWAEGTFPVDDLRTELRTDEATFVSVRDAVAAIEPLPGAPLSRALYLASAHLYIEVVRVLQAATEMPEGDLRTQVDLLARRLRVLADRVFDRGRLQLEPLLDTPLDPDVDVRLAEEVPIWEAERLAAGPPLAPPPVEPTELFPQRAETRPTQAREAWLEAVDGTAVPPADEVAAALDAGDTTALGALAGRFTAAAERLRAEPDPDTAGGREESARLRLGLLVHAEAARAGHAGALVGGTTGARLVDVGRRLLLVAAEPALWSPDVPPREPGLDAGLLLAPPAGDP